MFLLMSEQRPELLRIDTGVQECDATKLNSITKARYIIILHSLFEIKSEQIKYHSYNI